MGSQRLARGVARQDWLKPIEETLQSAIHKLFHAGGASGQKAKNFLHGTWVGHPLHVILTDIPIGAWTTALVFDVIDAATGDESFAKAADASIAFGLVGALGAAVTGLTDWQDTDPPARRIGVVHAALNITSVALFTSSLVARKRPSRAARRTLAVAGYLASALAAQLGGSLVYEQRIGVDHSSEHAYPKEFAAVADESELSDGVPTRVMHEQSPILLVRRGDQVFALAENCAHLGGPLSEGKLDGDIIQCPWHGSRFSIRDGHVVDGPAVHPQTCLETRIRDGKIEVRTIEYRKRQAEPAPVQPIADYSEPRTGTNG